MNLLSDLWLRDVALHLWQATLFGLVIVLIITLLPVPARLRHLAGGLALLRFLLPAGLLAPLAGFVPWGSAVSSWTSTGLGGLWMPAFVVDGDVLRVPPAVFHLPLPAILAALWGAGTILFAGVGIFRLVRGLRAVRRHAIPFSVEDRARLLALAGRVGLPPGRVSGCIAAPSGWLGVIGIFRSRIVVPEGLFQALDEKEVESVLLHELVHVKRRDNLFRFLQAGVVALFWFHPLVWWLDRRLRWESESACDEAVLRLTGANQVYATGLFKAVRFALGLNLPGVSGMSRTGLKSRLHAVLNHQHRKDSPVKAALTVSALVGLLGLATVFASPPAASETTAASAQPDKTAAELPAGNVWNVEEIDQLPVVTKQVPPAYPAALKKAGTQGTVVMGFVITETGNVTELTVVKSTNPAFDQPTMDAVGQWRFQPGLKDGKPVNVRMAVPIVFNLSPK